MQTSTLNYTYPEFNRLDMGNTQAVATAISNYVNRQYGGGRGRVLSSGSLPGVRLLRQPPAAKGVQIVVAQSVPPSHGVPPTHDAPPAHGATKIIYDWGPNPCEEI